MVWYAKKKSPMWLQELQHDSLLLSLAVAASHLPDVFSLETGHRLLVRHLLSATMLK